MIPLNQPTVARLPLALSPVVFLLGAGSPVPAAPGAAASLASSAHHQELVTRGPDYSARFDGQGLRFAAEQPGGFPLGLEFELVGARLGEVTIEFDAQAEPMEVGTRVAFERGSFTEWYEPRNGGLEQSFEFEALPDAAGDLVITGRLRSALPGVVDGAGLYFGFPGGPGIGIGGVTGIDAAGRSVAGTLSLEGDRLELRLPGEFVAMAELPLILDPLIGTSADGPDANQLGSPDVAYDEGADEYLLVYERSLGSAGLGRGIYGQRVSSTGQLLGAVIDIANSPEPLLRGSPRVANVDAHNQFVVAWEQSVPSGGQEIAVRLVEVGSAEMSSVQVIQRPAGAVDRQMDLGGSSTNLIGLGQCSAMIVFQRIAGGAPTVQFAEVQIQSIFFPTLTVDSPELLDTSGLAAGAPSISKTRDNNDYYCVVYEVTSPVSAIEPNQLRARLLGGDGEVESVLVLPQVAVDMTKPQVDGGQPLGGGPSRWVVAFEQRGAPVNGSVAIGAMELTSTGSVFNPILVASGEALLTAYGSNHFPPSVSFTGQEFHVAAVGRIQILGSGSLEFSVRTFERGAQAGPWV